MDARAWAVGAGGIPGQVCLSPMVATYERRRDAMVNSAVDKLDLPSLNGAEEVSNEATVKQGHGERREL